MSLMHPRHALAGAVFVILGLFAVRAQEPAPNPLLDEFVWRPIGPTNMGGRVDDVEAVESDPSTIYVGAASSGVWKTDNNGTTWMPVFDAEPNLSIGDVAIAPSNPVLELVRLSRVDGVLPGGLHLRQIGRVNGVRRAPLLQFVDRPPEILEHLAVYVLDFAGRRHDSDQARDRLDDEAKALLAHSTHFRPSLSG